MTKRHPSEDNTTPAEHRLSTDVETRMRSSRQFREKPADLQHLINEALDILNAFGVPMNETARRRESMAMAFIAVAGVTPQTGWSATVDFGQDRSMKSRDIIKFRNKHLGDAGSLGSSDNIRRKDLKLLVPAGIVVKSLPGSSQNTPTRGYAVHPAFARAIRRFGTHYWSRELKKVMNGYQTLLEQLSSERAMTRVPINLAPGVTLDFGPGPHNRLQAKIVHEFLPRYGYGAEVLYIGDAEERDAHYNEERLKELGFFTLDNQELPDIVAHSVEKDWLYVIEAVAITGPIDALRHIQFRKLLRNVKSGVVYVTAFLDRGEVFRKWMPEIAWETEVWVASDPDHVIHFNGDRFLGPHPSST